MQRRAIIEHATVHSCHDHMLMAPLMGAAGWLLWVIPKGMIKLVHMLALTSSAMPLLSYIKLSMTSGYCRSLSNHCIYSDVTS